MSDYAATRQRSIARRDSSRNLAPQSGDYASTRAARQRQKQTPAYVLRAQTRLQKMGAFEANTPILRQRIMAEERERDGIKDMEIKRNPLISYAAGVNQSLGQVGESLVGLYAPEYANKLKDAREVEYGTPHGAAGVAGQAVGMVGNIAATIGTGGALGSVGLAASAARGMAVTSGLFAQQGAGRVRQQVAERRSKGEIVSWQDEWSATVLTGVIEGASGAISAGVASKMAQAFKTLAPQVQGAFRFGGKTAAIAKLKAALPGMGIEGTEEAFTQMATNMVDIMYDITPGLRVTEGALEAGLIGAGLAPILGGVSGMGLKLRASAAQQGSPTPPGLNPDPTGMDTLGLPEPLEAARPVDDLTGSQIPVRSNGKAHEQTQQMYVDAQNERAMSRADRVISKVSVGDTKVEDALYKAINMLPPTTYETGEAANMGRMERMRKSKAKPKTLDSKKTVDAVVKALRTADPNQTVPDATVQAERMIAKVGKYLQTTRMEDVARDHHHRQVARAMAQGKDVPQAVQDEYAVEPIAETDQSIDLRTETWDNDAWGSDPVTYDQAAGIDNMSDPGDATNALDWKVVDYPDGESGIENAAGDIMDGPFASHDLAAFELQHYQEKAGVMDGPREYEVGRIDGWQYKPAMPTPPQRTDGTPPNADADGPVPGERSSPTMRRRNGNDFTTPISSRIADISMRIYGKLMGYESAVAWETAKTLRVVKDWGNALHRSFKLHGKKRAIELQGQLHLALGNGQFDAAYQIMVDNAPTEQDGRQLVAGMKKIRRQMDALQRRQRDAGIEVSRIDNYFPRAVKNHKKYLAALKQEEKSSITKKLDAESKRLKRDLSQDERQTIINDDLQGYGEQFREQSVRHGAQRTVVEIDPEMAHLYERYDVALVQYLSRTIESIHTAKFFGKGSVEESIGKYVDEERENGHLTEEDSQSLKSLLGSRFIGGQRSPHKFWRTVRDLGYITTLTNPISAVTQAGDISLSIVENGLAANLKAAPASVRGIRNIMSKQPNHVTSPEALTQYDIGVLQATAEFGSPSGLSNYLSYFMRKSGFTLMDGIGKTLNVNSSYQSMKAAAMGQKGTQVIDGTIVQNTEDSAEFTKMEKEWGPILGDEFQQTMQDFRAGEITDNVRMVLFTKLSRIQPISLSEFPAWYLNNPNGRILYMLKSFTIKQFDFMKRMSYDQIANGQYRAGMKGLTSIAFIYSAMFGIDLLKDFLMQRETNMNNIDDKAWATALKMFGTSRYMKDKAISEGPGAAAWGALAPPSGWLSDPVRDLSNVPDFLSGEKSLSELRFYRNVPLIGKWAYYGVGHGNTLDAERAKTERRRDRKDIREEAKKALLDGDRTGAAAILGVYNDGKPADMARISMKSVRNSIQRDRKKARDDASGRTERREERRLR